MSKHLWTSRQEKLQELLRKIRTDQGLTQAELAAKLKAPQSFVSKYESGERRLDILEIQDICKACGITLEEFARLIS